VSAKNESRESRIGTRQLRVARSASLRSRSSVPPHLERQKQRRLRAAAPGKAKTPTTSCRRTWKGKDTDYSVPPHLDK